MASGDNIKVAIKVRPLIKREISQQLKILWAIQGHSIYQLDDQGNRVGEGYTFDHIFNENKSNEDIYESVVQPVVQSCMEGFNATIFTYGQTSSGKTYTMMGGKNIMGIVQLTVNDVFKFVTDHPERDFLLRCCYIEIYNEKINDLLDKTNKGLSLREDVNGRITHGARHAVVNSSEDLVDLLRNGNKNRKVGFTRMNERSSRSHTILQVIIESKSEDTALHVSQLNLVDLAGSERIAQTQSEGVRLKEGVNINKSLSALGNVIRQLSRGGFSYVNYRDSHLTRLLQDSLGGNARALIIANITVAAEEETKSTLEFAQRAKLIRNRPELNLVTTNDQPELLHIQESLSKAYEKIKQFEAERASTLELIKALQNEQEVVRYFYYGKNEKHQESSKPHRRHTLGSFSSSIPIRRSYFKVPDKSRMSIISDDGDNLDSSLKRESTGSQSNCSIESRETGSVRSTRKFTLPTIAEDSIIDIDLLSYPDHTISATSNKLINEDRDNCDKENIDFDFIDLVSDFEDDVQTTGLENERPCLVSSFSETCDGPELDRDILQLQRENGLLKSRCSDLEKSFAELQSFTRLEKLYEDDEIKVELEAERMKSTQLQADLDAALQKEVQLLKDNSSLQHEICQLNEYTNRLKSTLSQLLMSSSEQVIDISNSLHELENILQTSNTKVRSVYIQTDFESYLTKKISENIDAALTNSSDDVSGNAFTLQDGSYDQTTGNDAKEGKLSIQIVEPKILEKEIIELKRRLQEKEEEYHLALEKIADSEHLSGSTDLQEVKKFEYRKQEKDSRNQQMKLKKLQGRFNLVKKRLAIIEKSVASNEELDRELKNLKLEILNQKQTSESDIKLKLEQTTTKLEHAIRDKKLLESEVQLLHQQLEEQGEEIKNKHRSLVQFQHFLDWGKELYFKFENDINNISDSDFQEEFGIEKVMQSIEALVSKKEEFECNVRNLSHQLQQKIDEKSTLENKIEGINSEIVDLRKKSDEQLTFISEMKKTIEFKNAHPETLVSNVSQLEQSNSQLKNKMEHMSQEFDNYKQLNEEKKTIIENLERQLSEMKKINDDRTATLEKITQNLMDLEQTCSIKDNEIVDLTRKITQMEQLGVEKLMSYETLQKEITELKQQIDLKDSINQKLKQKVSDLNNINPQAGFALENSELELSQLKQNNNELTNSIKCLSKELDEVKEICAKKEMDIKNANSQLWEIKNKYDKKTDCIDKLEHEGKDIEKDRQIRELLRQILVVLADSRQNNTDKEIHDQPELDYNLECVSHKVNKYNENEVHEIGVEDLVTQLLKIQNVCTEKIGCIKKLEGHIANLEDTNKHKETQISQLVTEVSQLTDSADAKPISSEELQDTVIALELANLEVSQLKQKNDELTNNVECISQELDKHKQLREEKEMNIEELNSQLLDIRNTCNNKINYIEKLEKNLADLEEKNSEKDIQITELLKQISEWKVKHNGNIEITKQAQIVLEKALSELSQFKETNFELTESLEQMSLKLDNYKELQGINETNINQLEVQLLEVRNISNEKSDCIEKLKRHIAELENKNDHKDIQLSELLKDLAHSKQSDDELLQQTVKNLELQITELLTKVAELQDVADSKHTINEELEQQNCELKKICNDRDTCIEELLLKSRKLTEMIDSQKKINENVIQQNSDSQKLFKEKEVCAEKLMLEKEQLEKINKEKEMMIENLNLKITDLLKEIAQLKDINQNTQTLIDPINENLAQQSTNLKEIESKEAEIEKLTHHISQLKQINSELEDNMECLSKKLVKHEKLTDQKDSVIKRLEQMFTVKETELTELRKNVTELEKKIIEKELCNERLQKHILELKEFIDLTTVNHKQLIRNISELEGANANLSQKLSEFDDMKCLLDQKNSVIRDLKMQLADTNNVHSKKNSTTEKLAENMAQLEDINVRNKSEMKDLINQHKEMEMYVDNEKSINKALQQEIYMLNDLVTSKQVENDNLIQKMSELRMVNETNMSYIEQLTIQISQLKQGSSNINNDIQKLSQELDSEKQLSLEKDNVITNLNLQLSNLGKLQNKKFVDVQLLEQTKRELEQLNTKKDSQLTEMTKQLKELKEFNREEKTTNEKLKEEMLRLKIMNDSQYNSDGKLLQQVLELRKLTNDKQLDNNRLEQQLREVKQSYGELEVNNKQLLQQTITMRKALEEKQIILDKLDIENNLLISKLNNAHKSKKNELLSFEDSEAIVLNSSSPKSNDSRRCSLSKAKRHHLHDQKRFGREKKDSLSIDIAIDDLVDVYKDGMCMWNQLDADIKNAKKVDNDVWIAKSRFFITSMEASRDSLNDILKKIKTIPEILQKFEDDISDMDVNLSKSKTELSSLKVKNDELNKYVSEITDQLKKYKKSLEINNLEKSQLHNKLTELEIRYQELSSLKETNDLLNKYVLEISDQLKKFKNLLDITTSEKVQLHKRLTELENQYQDNKKTASQLEKLHYEKIRENLDLASENKSIKEQMKKLRKKPATREIEIQCDASSEQSQDMMNKYAFLKRLAVSRGKEIEKLKSLLGIPLDKECK